MTYRPEVIIDYSTSNTTTTPLASGATYTGTGEVAPHDGVTVSCKTDNPGTLYFDFSPDGTNWDAFPSSGFRVAADIHEYHTGKVNGRYFRVRLVNDSGAQSYLRLYTYFGPHSQPNAPLNQPLGLDADSILVRPTFDWLDVSRGLLTGVRVVKKFGANLAVGTSYTPVCFGGSYQTPTTAQSLEFVSSDSADALNGAGLHELTVEGIGPGWVEQSVSTAAHATDGTVAVAISGTWLRVFRIYVSLSGTYATQSAGSHAGTITVRASGGGVTWGQIPLDNSFPVGQSLIGAYTVPTGYTGYVFLHDLSVDTGKTVDVAFFARENADDTSSSYSGGMRVKSVIRGLVGGSVADLSGGRIPLKVTGPADVGFLAAGATTPEVAVEFEVFLVNE